MNPTFTWSVPAKGLSTITHNGQADTVVQVQYTLTATEGEHTQSINGVVKLTPSEDGTFIPFEDLTQEQVLAWVEASVRPVDVTHHKMSLTRRLERMANPPVRPVIKPAPWNTCVQGG
jgi:hypothetical protein